ncbi:MAG TPA: TetR/AcrR family transcriptional regulator [Solirubrobacterales bacterium]|jgi:AcrR family transcriptional regulator|nr:TetR/AcrR family transcriptional regulator [Solirubrobacterales bacterium]
MERLPRGRHGLSPEFVARNQRERLIAGLTAVLYEVGYQRTTVSLIGQRASVSKSDFYKHFESKDDCFYAAYDVAIDRIRERVNSACAKHEAAEWGPRVRDGIVALLTLLEAEPPLAKLALVEGLRAGRGIYDRYQAAVESFVPPLQAGAPEAPGGGPVPEATGEAVVGGIASLLGRRVLAGDTEHLRELRPDVLRFALTPYLGAAEAGRIISAG